MRVDKVLILEIKIHHYQHHHPNHHHHHQGGGANQDEGGHSVPQGDEEYQNGEGGGQNFIRMMCF